jgi:CDP-diacylglycerol--glycerol-3-phosphate 3-phosphatidyltransferase
MTANMATAGGIVAIVLASSSLYLGAARTGLGWLLLLAPVFLVLRMAMNALDGMLARERGQGTVAGEIWNEALDVVGDNVCYGVLYFVPDGPRVSIVLFLLCIWAAEFFGVLGKSMPGGVRRHEALAGGKPDRAVWMGLMALILYFSPGFLMYIPYYLGALSGLVIFTALLRVRATLKAASGKPYKSFTWIGR